MSQTTEQRAAYSTDTLEFFDPDLYIDKLVLVMNFKGVTRQAELDDEEDYLTEIANFEKEQIEQAIQICTKKKIFALAYMLGILNNWKRNGWNNWNKSVQGESQQSQSGIVPPGFWAQNAPFTPEFLVTCSSLLGIPGVYLFYDTEILYVGKSGNLGKRIITSYVDKHTKYSKFNTRMCFIEANETDAGILELYFIAKLLPAFNTKDKSPHALTLEISPIPSFSPDVLVLKEAA